MNKTHVFPCQACQTPNRAGAKFCRSCGKPLTIPTPAASRQPLVFCKHCDKPNPPNARWCAQCGQPLNAVPQATQTPVRFNLKIFFQRRALWLLIPALLGICVCVLGATFILSQTAFPARTPTPTPRPPATPTPTAEAPLEEIVTALAPLPTEIATLLPDIIQTAIPELDLEIPRLTDEEEIAIGKEAADEFERTNPISNDPALNARVISIGNSIFPLQPRTNLSFTFKVIDSLEINAFALPGGFIYVTRGILEFVESDDELAGVIGHEIAHVALRHGAQQIEILAYAQATLEGLISGNTDLANIYQDHRAQFATDFVTTLALNGWGRELELDADEYGTVYMANAGYDPYAVVQLFERFATEEVFNGDIFTQLMATHPPFAVRIERVEFAIQEHHLGSIPQGMAM